MTETIANPEWTAPENWAWGEIVAGRAADFTARHGEPAPDPRWKRGWDDERALGAAFLRALLFDKEWVGEVPIMGVRIAGAVWRDALDLQHALLAWPLCLEACRFEAPVDLTGLRTTARLSLRGSAFRGRLILAGAATRRANLAGVRLVQGLAAAGAAIEGALDLDGAAVTGTLDLADARAQTLLLRNGSAGDVTLSYCDVAQEADFSGARIGGEMKMIGLRVGQDLLLGGSETRAGLFRGAIVLDDALVGGHLLMTGATVRGPLKANGLEVKRSAFLRGSQSSDEIRRTGETRFLELVNLTSAVIHGHLELVGTTFEGTVDLRTIQIMESLAAWRVETGPTCFRRELLLAGARIKGSVVLCGSEFGLIVDMFRIRIGENLETSAQDGHASVFRLGLTLNESWIGGAVIFTDTFFYSDVQLQGAKIDGNVRCDGAVLFGRTLDFADARIGGHLFINELLINEQEVGFPKCLAELRLQNTTVGGNVELRGEFFGPLTLSGLKVTHDLFIQTSWAIALRGRQTLVHGPVKFGYGEVKGVVDFNGTKFAGGLGLGNIKIGQDLRLAAEVWGPVNLSGGNFGGGIDFSQAELRTSLDLSAAKISGQLCFTLGRRADDAELSVKLDLRDAKAGSLQVLGPEVEMPGWPDKGSVQLDGLVYDRLGGTDPDQTREMMGRSAKWLGKWLELDDPYSPQPYEQLAATLRQAGEVEKANRILHAGRERARKSAWYWLKPLEKKLGFFRWLGLSALKVTIGYGIGLRFFYALIWALALTGIGVFVLLIHPPLPTSEVQLNDWPDRLAYSFDQLLPIVELNKSFSEVALPHAGAQYFYLHRLLGFLLGAFITAGIAGLTQRSRS